MRELLDIVSETQLNEATYDRELDKIVAKVLRGSAGFSKGKMIHRDLVLNKGFNMATKLDNTRDKDKLSIGNLLGKIKDFVVTDDFLERQYFGKIAKRLRLDGMFMNDGNFITTDVDEFDRYQSGSGSQEDAERQNNMGILPGKIAKKFNIEISPTEEALFPIKISGYTNLSGVSIKGSVKLSKNKQIIDKEIFKYSDLIIKDKLNKFLYAQ